MCVAGGTYWLWRAICPARPALGYPARFWPWSARCRCGDGCCCCSTIRHCWCPSISTWKTSKPLAAKGSCPGCNLKIEPTTMKLNWNRKMEIKILLETAKSISRRASKLEALCPRGVVRVTDPAPLAKYLSESVDIKYNYYSTCWANKWNKNFNFLGTWAGSPWI